MAVIKLHKRRQRKNQNKTKQNNQKKSLQLNELSVPMMMIKETRRERGEKSEMVKRASRFM